MRSGQLILQSDDHSITFGDLQRQHLDVLRESTGERTQLGHPGAAHSSELGFKGADALLQGLGRRSPVTDCGSTELGEKIGRSCITIGKRCNQPTLAVVVVRDGRALQRR